MRRDDYLLLIASGLLKLPTDALSPALEHFDQYYQLDEPAKAGTVSLAGTLNGQLLGFREWIKILSQRNIVKVQCSWASYKTQHSLEPHIAAAFAGSQLLTLAVTSDAGIATYLLHGEFSRQHEMTAEHFVGIIDYQKNSIELWTRISELVEQHLILNNKPLFENGTVSTYLAGPGRAEFDFLSSTLVQEVQIECEVQNEPFTFPDHLKHLFYKSDFLPEFTERRIVFLYPIGNPSAADLLKLIDAHALQNKVWKKLISQLEAYPIESLSELRLDDFPDCLVQMTSDELVAISSPICRSIAELCEEAGIDRIIPDDLKDIFGPDEKENKRAQARGRSDNKWYLSQNNKPWEMYVFDQVEELQLQSSSSLALARTLFRDCLMEIAGFARQVQSPFEEAFRLGIFFLTEENRNGPFDESHQADLIRKLELEHFTDPALQQFNEVMSYTSQMRILQFTPAKIADVLAVSVADVFGGMGSWNDQYFEEHQETYEHISAKLFESLKQFFSCALSD